mmetsp:Transcript_24331/g.43588  ORF Transcript_24331/g.43588 Transcript_24331/m.43588 type:complete len:87 (-) Transcript_24331:838-1098(-)
MKAKKSITSFTDVGYCRVLVDKLHDDFVCVSLSMNMYDANNSLRLKLAIKSWNNLILQTIQIKMQQQQQNPQLASSPSILISQITK